MEEEVMADIMNQYDTRPGLAMVNSIAGFTNFYIPSDVIIDAFMPNGNVICYGGQNNDNKLEDVKCVILDRYVL